MIVQQNPIKRGFVCLFSKRTTDTQWRHKSKISEKLGWCGRQNMLPPYLEIWDWDWIFGRAVNTISSVVVRSLWTWLFLTFMVMEAVRGQKLYCECTLWHSISMFDSSHCSATSRILEHDQRSWFLVFIRELQGLFNHFTEYL